jgi:murein DD-endopeptidase MepM/ murein hydrolase activator NlpD
VVVQANVAGPAHGQKFLVANIKRSLFTDLAEVTLTGPRPALPEPDPPPGPDLGADLGSLEGQDTADASKPGAGSDVGTQTRQGAVSTAGFAWPVQGTISSGFGSRNGKMHEGLDIAVPVGVAVIASKDGTVTFAGLQSGYGNVVYITHGGGLSGSPRFEAAHEQETRYGHLSKFNCRRGQVVRQGDVIGYSGGAPGSPGAGDATGPHLHFEIRIGGVARNPMDFLQGTASTKDTYKRPIKGVF